MTTTNSTGLGAISVRRFRDRRDAGEQLARELGAFAHRPDVVVLGLPRGGMPVAYEMAQALGAPLDLFLVRKLGVPGHEEYAMGAIATGGVRVLNSDVIRALSIPSSVVEAVTAGERRELEHLVGRHVIHLTDRLRQNRPPPLHLEPTAPRIRGVAPSSACPAWLAEDR